MKEVAKLATANALGNQGTTGKRKRDNEEEVKAFEETVV